MTQPDRTPYCHKIRYGITGAPILTDDDMDGSHAPGVGVRPTLIELVYSPARDGKPASVDASVTGAWTRFGQPDGSQMETHFRNGPDGWPAWLAAEARLHDPAAPVPPPTPRSGVTQHDQPVYKLVCSNDDCTSDDWTALDEDGYVRYFDNPSHAREWGRLNGWESGDRVLCPADAAEAREAREQAEDIAAAVADAMLEG